MFLETLPRNVDGFGFAVTVEKWKLVWKSL